MSAPLELSRPGTRILITRLDRIGDVVLSTPVFKAVKEYFPKSRLSVMVRSAVADLVKGNPWVDEVIAYEKEGKHRSAAATVSFALSLRGRFDAVIHLHATNRAHWISFLAGIPVRIGYSRKLPFLLTHPVREAKKRGEFHEAEYNFDLLSLIGVPKPQELAIYVPVEAGAEREFLQAAAKAGLGGEKFFCVNPSASCPSKIWPAEKFSRLIDRIVSAYGFRPVLIGAEGDRAISRKVKSHSKSDVLDLTGQLSLRTLAAGLKQAAFLVSNDSGPVHIASGVGTRVLSIFGRNEPGLGPKRWGPIGRRTAYVQKDVGCFTCLAHKCRIGFLCLEVLSVEDVLEGLKSLEPFFASKQAAAR